jgi:hypothetical protein
MDQLKIVLEHRFWILSTLAVLLPPIGWYISTDDMATQTDKRVKAIDQKVKNLDGLKKNLSTANNPDWTKGLAAINGRLASRVEEAHKDLYDHQRPAMVWHPLVKQKFDEAKVKFRGETAENPKAFVDMRRFFASRYQDMWDPDVKNVIEPFNMITGDGKVLLNDGTATAQITRAPTDTWGDRVISASEMWDAQEDLWMMHALMTAVAKVNEGSRNIDDARIKKLSTAILRGGSKSDLDDRRKKKQSTNAQAPGAAPAAGGQQPGGSSLSIGLGSIGGRRAPGDGDQGPKSLPMIKPDDIFGSVDEGMPSGAGGGKRGGQAAAAAAAPPVERYVDRGAKWRARGFVLRVVMDHQEIPKLLTVLTEGPFPVEIWHVEHLDPEQKVRASTSAATFGDTAEDGKRVRANMDRLNLALNQSNLADVQIAGAFILYDEAAAPASHAATPSSPSPTTKPPASASQPANSQTGPAAGANGTKPASTAGAGTAGSAAKSPAPGKTASPATGPAGASPSAKPLAPSASAPAGQPGPAAKPAQPAKP